MTLSRRRILVAGAAFGSLVACRADPRPPERPTLIDPAEPVPPLPDRIALLEQRHNAYVGLYATDLASGVEAAHRKNDPFAVCSTFKTYAAARVLQMSAAGEVRLDDTVFVDPGEVVANSPVTGPKAGSRMPLAEVCAAALQHSDNTAGNLLLQTIGGPAALTAFARSIGYVNAGTVEFLVDTVGERAGHVELGGTEDVPGTGPAEEQFDLLLAFDGQTDAAVRVG